MRHKYVSIIIIVHDDGDDDEDDDDDVDNVCSHDWNWQFNPKTWTITMAQKQTFRFKLTISKYIKHNITEPSQA